MILYIEYFIQFCNILIDIKYNIRKLVKNTKNVSYYNDNERNVIKDL